MNYVKFIVGIVIAIALIGVTATFIGDMTQEKVREEVVTFEVVENMGSYSSTPNVYDILLSYAVFDDSDIINLVDLELIDIAENIGQFTYSDGYFYLSNGTYALFNEYDISGTFSNDDNYLTDGDIVTLTFEVTTPPTIDGTIAPLLLLAPIILTAVAITYVYTNKDKFLK